MKIKALCSSIVILFLSSCVNNIEIKNVYSIKISQEWKFTKSGAEEWLDAEVPGSVHTDLLNNGKIEDPFYRMNELDQQWIDKENWEYMTTINITEGVLKKDRIRLLFEGLDTYSDVFLNDRLILQTDNMFRKYEVEVKHILQLGDNVLKIIFRSPVKEGLKKFNELDYIIPVSNNDQSELGGLGDKRVSVFSRKAMYHFGWDWGPRLVTSGIWKPIYLKAWDETKIEDFQVYQDDIHEDKANLSLLLDVETITRNNYSIEIYIDNNKVLTEPFNLTSGLNKINLKVGINSPKLWWPSGLGDQYLYVVKAVVKRNENILDIATHKIGLRTIDIVQEPIGDKESFYFKVNDIPVFMKGANYIPQDIFLNRVTPDKYEHILQSMVDANMNMIRVWGGGIYEKDIFYELCDSKGLLVWQDFMFACAMFPGDSSFLENVRIEAEQNIKRLRNHPSIALWCGNNECLSAWTQWGWKDKVIKEYGKEVAEIIWTSYENIFHEILPNAVNEFDPGTFYWSSSPSEGMGKPAESNAGDQHYWGVWWGKEPFANYATTYAPFMSEYGFQSFPELKTVKSYTVEEDWDIYSDVMKSHQRSTIGNKTIEEYMDRHFPEPKDFESFLYVAQILQAEGVKVAMEGNRRVMPQCMGSLFWQINDCWPVASWSSIDYYGRWKAEQYYAKKAFNNILISPYSLDSTDIDIYCISDKLNDVNAQLIVKCFTFNGTELSDQKYDILLKANSSAVYADFHLEDSINAEEIVLYTGLLSNEKLISDNCFYFKPVKHLNLPQPTLNYTFEKNNDSYEIHITTDYLAKNVYIYAENDIQLSDNYFDMMPGAQKIVHIIKGDPDDLKSNKIKIITLNEAF